ncbi:MAG: hypothetical protein AMJ37_02570 [Dehalococcoidia bacterium DG_18]|nr:MAG: hypothetical protein AMJ37_02570 [Dehalococcoidia bacterium DG_18]
MGEKVKKRAAKGVKSFRDLKSVHDVKSGISKRISSMPRRGKHNYLDLYILQKELDILQMETGGVDRWRGRVQQRADEVRQKIAAQEEKVLQGLGISPESLTDRHSQPKNEEEAHSDKHEGTKWTTVTLDY